MRDRLRRTRVRLTLVYVGAFAAVSAVAATSFGLVFAHFEYSAIDSSLSAQAQGVLSSLEDSNGRVSLAGGEQLPAETPGGIAIASLLVGSDGRILVQSGSAPDAKGLVAIAQRDRPSGGSVYETRFVGGNSQRIFLRKVDLNNGASAVLVLTRPIDELEETLTLVGILLAAAVGGLVLGAASLGYWLAGRALGPVRVMSATARDISEHDLHRRILLDLPPGDELGELAATFNAMLARLESAFEGLQRFTSDAAHELRAPLALMRTQVDVILRKQRTAEQYEASHRALLEEIERLSRMADQLLLLARADAGALAPRREMLEVRDFLEEVLERWRPTIREHRISMLADLPAEGTIRADPDLLRRLFDNLLDNALRHTPAGGEVRAVAAPEAGRWRIEVQDTGPGVDPQLRHRLFERFTRADPARGRDSGGAGLGLSLCAAIAQAHGGSITFEEPADQGGARFVVRLPTTETGTEGATT